MKKILITVPCYGKTDPKPLDMLKEKGFEYTRRERAAPFTKKEMMDVIKDYDGVILGTDPCDKEVIDAGEKLQVISRFGVGCNNVDVKYCNEKGIKFFRTLGVNADAVADSTFALLLAVSKRIVPIDRDVKAGKWYEPETFEINNKTLGLIGFGQVGSQVAKRAAGFDMKVVAYDPYKNEELAQRVGVTYLDTMEGLLEVSDVVSLHLPLTHETYHMIGSKELDMMKPNGILINTARGGIVDEDALVQALEQKKLLGAGLDVFENEPLEQNSRFFKLDNVVLSPHGAADTFETIRKVSIAATKNLFKGFGL